MKRIYCFTLIIFAMTTSTLSQSADKTYILVHGAWYGGWCWYKVVPLLEAKDLDRRSIVQNMPCQQIFELPSSHPPFFSHAGKAGENIR